MKKTIASLIAKAPIDQFEAELLLMHALKKPRSFLRAWPEHEIDEVVLTEFESYLSRRLQGEPIAYILGKREFWSLPFIVTRDTLIPRPETELLIDEVLKLFPTQETLKVADLGTGSGAIGLALAHERPSWEIFATDVSESALAIARKNAQQLEIKNISFYSGTWCTALPCCKLDVIVSNPPYLAETEWDTYASGLAFEPRQALVSGIDGLDAIREISQAAKSCLKTGGYLLIEHGFSQAAAVRAIFAADGYGSIYSVRDISGQERITIGNILP